MDKVLLLPLINFGFRHFENEIFIRRRECNISALTLVKRKGILDPRVSWDSSGKFLGHRRKLTRMIDPP